MKKKHTQETAIVHMQLFSFYVKCTLEFFYNSSFPAKSWQDPASIEGKLKLPIDLPGIEPTTCRSSVPHSTDWAREDSVGDVWSEFSFVSCTTSQVGLCLFLESIEHDFISNLIHTGTPNSDLAQSVEHGTDDLEVVGSILGMGNLFFCSSPSMLAGSCHENNEL